MSIWIVMDGDYDGDWVTAVYDSEALARQHVDAMGGHMTVEEIRSSPHPDVTSPEKITERTAAHERAVRQHADYVRQRARASEMVEACRPNPPHMRLCSCQTFTSPSWTPHGYCSYCGGWSPEVFRSQMGEHALQSAINDLDIHKRERMRQIPSVHIGQPEQS